MSDKVNDALKEYARFGLGRQIWKKILIVLAAITVFITVYMLILPAVTQEAPTYCGYEEHKHSEECYEYVEKYDCDKEHEHFDECIVKVKTLKCLKVEHTHNDYCFVEPTAATEDVYNDEYDACITPQHTHVDSCYDEEGNVLCNQVEHKHSQACIWGTPENDEYRVNNVIALINLLPSNDEVEAKLNEFNDTGDYESYEAYYKELYDKVCAAYVNYEDIGSKLQKKVENRQALLSYDWVYYKSDYAATDSKKINFFNYYDSATANKSLLVYGKSVGQVSSFQFQYWYAVVVEENAEGDLYVKSYYDYSLKDKSNLKATTANGFVFLIHGDSNKLKCSVGDYVSVTGFDYKTASKGYSSSGYGTITFDGEAPYKGKEEKDNTSLLHVVEGADTYNLIKVNLYDYSTNINDKYLTNKTTYPGFQQDNGTTGSMTSLSKYTFNFGNNITTDLAAGQSGVTDNAGGINDMSSVDRANRPIANAMALHIGDDGYPKLKNGESLSWLFSDGTYAKKQNTDNINGLFQRNETTGEYYYNSHLNHAQFDYDTNTFTLYKEKITPNFMMYPFGNFMPFFDIVHDSKRSSDIDKAYLQSIAKSAAYKYEKQGAGSEYNTLATKLTSFISLMDSSYSNTWSAKDCVNEYFKVSSIPKSYSSNSELSEYYTLDYDEPSNFFFGMDMEMNFIQPKNGLTGLTGKEEMIFYFTGDDDVWVYLDGVLFLDLSGIHRHVGGKIDFVRGVVSYYSLDTNTGDVSDKPYQEISFADILKAAGENTDCLNAKGTFKDYSIHNFKFYYMERGAGSGVCRMNFNLPLLKENSISITKELTVNEIDTREVLGDPYFTFSVLKAIDGVKTQEAFIDEGEAYDVYDSAGNFIETRTVGSNGTIKIRKSEVAVISGIMSDSGQYYVRELFDPEIFEQYESVYVDGSNTTSMGDVTVGTDVFVGYDSPIKDIAAGSTTFSYNNVVDMKKLGKLSLKKKVVGSGDFLERVYEFSVSLDGEKLVKGYEYEVISSDGAVRTQVVQDEGVVLLKADETVIIYNLIAGSQYTIEETSGSADSFIVTYENEGKLTFGNVVTGTVYPETEIEMNVTNSEKGTTVNIPCEKVLLNSDGIVREYTFSMQQCSDISASETLSDEYITTVTMPGEQGKISEDFVYTLNYMETDVPQGKTKLYYRISEVEDETSASYTVFDKNVYVAEITVLRTKNDISAALTAMYKNGEALNKNYKAEFINELTSSLVISKTVEGNAAESNYKASFKFNITLMKDEKPLSGTFAGIKTAADGTKTQLSLDFSDDGQLNTLLKHGETLVIKGIPVGTLYTVKEDTSGYYIYCVVGGGSRINSDTADGEIILGKNEVEFFNYTTKELPATGGIGVYGMYTIGALLILIALILLIKKRREENNS